MYYNTVMSDILRVMSQYQLCDIHIQCIYIQTVFLFSLENSFDSRPYSFCVTSNENISNWSGQIHTSVLASA